LTLFFTRKTIFQLSYFIKRVFTKAIRRIINSIFPFTGVANTIYDTRLTNLIATNTIYFVSPIIIILAIFTGYTIYIIPYIIVARFTIASAWIKYSILSSTSYTTWISA
jgi:hypothetical protein